MQIYLCFIGKNSAQHWSSSNFTAGWYYIYGNYISNNIFSLKVFTYGSQGNVTLMFESIINGLGSISKSFQVWIFSQHKIRVIMGLSYQYNRYYHTCKTGCFYCIETEPCFHNIATTDVKIYDKLLRIHMRHWGCNFTFKCIFLDESVIISIKISLKFATKGPINNIATLIQIMVRPWPGNKPLAEPKMVRLPMHTRHLASMS